MILHDEIYFEITLEGNRADLEKFASYALSGVFDDFFEVSEDYVIYDDNHSTANESEKLNMVFTNDDYGIELNRLDPEEFIEILCRGAKELYVSGCVYDIEDEEYRFVSHEGDSGFVNAKHLNKFNDELDEIAAEEDAEEEEEGD